MHDPAPPAPSRAGRPPEGRYEQLLAAAAAAYAELGYHRTSVKSIVDRAGVATGTFYLYFPTKEASALAIIDRLYELVMGAVASARVAWHTSLDKLAASAEAVLDTFGRHEDLSRVVLIQAPGAHPDFDRRLQAIHAELAGLVARDIREAVEEGRLPPQDEFIAARCVVGAVYEILNGWMRDRLPPDPKTAAPGLRAFVLRGIGAVREP
ncbi:MAG TPA: TetR/AcrR family transcriptional regulator [Bacillota bacterium]